MSTLRTLAVALMALPLAACLKDEVDVAALTNNPFDPGYNGPPVFVLDGTYLQPVDIGGSTILYQAIAFRVREELFLSPAGYSVALTDQQNGHAAMLNPDPPGGNAFKYLRQPLPGQPVCLELRLSNNQSSARPEVICATL